MNEKFRRKSDERSARVVLPELLDELPPGHPDAVASRRDLVLINHLMGNYRWLQRMLCRHLERGDSIVELGSGDGKLGSRLRLEHATLTGIDFAPRPDIWPGDWPWIQGDLMDHLAGHRAEVVIANLILHHFDSDQLGRLGELLSTSPRRVLIFSEPARRRIHHWQGRALGLVGLNRVTRHDLPISIDAGFRGSELKDLLGLDNREWRVDVKLTCLGAYRFLAVRV